MTPQKLAEALSLQLSFPAIGLSLFVVILWSSHLPALLKGHNRCSFDYFILGVIASFSGEILDSLYWAVAWTLEFIDHPAAPTAVQYGVWFNIVFRQALTILAAFCHLKSYQLHRAETLAFREYFPSFIDASSNRIFSVFLAVLLAGLIYVAVLIIRFH